MYQQGYNMAYPYYNQYYHGLEAENHMNNNRMKVYGQGTLNVKPDIAEVIIGIITENKQLEVAQKENTEISSRVLDSIKKLNVAEEDLQTQAYNINSKYDYIEGKQVFKGYEVLNSFMVRIRNIKQVGKIIDTGVKNGANTVNNISFTVSEPSRYYQKALKLAIEDAQNKAIVMAEKLNVKVKVVPFQIVEQRTSSRVPIQAMSFSAAGVSTPIEAGENKITAAIKENVHRSV